MSLSSLGVSTADERVYRFLLRHPGADPAAHPEAIDRLQALGLVKMAADGTVRAAEPQAALDGLMRRRLADLNSELDRITSASSALPSLLAERTAGEAVELVERIEGREHVQQRIWEVSEGLGECLAVHNSPPKIAEELVTRTLKDLQRGVVYRTIVQRQVLQDPEAREFLLTIHRAGDRHRVTDEQIQPLIIIDRSAAFVPLEAGRSEAGALLIRQPGIVATLVDLFENIWARSADLEPDPSELSTADKEVLDLLNRFGKDEAAARAMGVSVRTFRARVAVLMARLGAASRFQAGTRARERGWV